MLGKGSQANPPTEAAADNVEAHLNLRNPTDEVTEVARLSHDKEDHETIEELERMRTRPHRDPYHRLNDPPPKRQPAIVASQIMSSPVITVSPHDHPETAWAIFKEKRFRHVPVTSESGKLVGILSDRDILRGYSRNMDSIRGTRPRRLRRGSGRTVASIMTGAIACSRAQDAASCASPSA